jgi:hypothetical protein
MCRPFDFAQGKTFARHNKRELIQHAPPAVYCVIRGEGNLSCQASGFFCKIHAPAGAALAPE